MYICVRFSGGMMVSVDDRRLNFALDINPHHTYV